MHETGTSADTLQLWQTLRDLAQPFVADSIEQGLVPVESGALPPPFGRLLLHRAHMTSTLRSFYGASPTLNVLATQADEHEYRRMILLSLESDPERVVELGIVRIRLAVLDEQVRREILGQRTPLGDILIRHNVLRRIEPRWFLHVAPPSPLLAYFPIRQQPTGYARIGVIHYDGQPAIDLFELVVDARRVVSEDDRF